MSGILWFGMAVIRPVVRTTKMMQNIAEGDGDPTVRTPEYRNDEIGALPKPLMRLYAKEPKWLFRLSCGCSGATIFCKYSQYLHCNRFTRRCESHQGLKVAQDAGR